MPEGVSYRDTRAAPVALRAMLLATWLALILSGLAMAAPSAQAPGPGETTFKSRCTSCHTIGQGDLVGPDLKGVTQRRDPAWVKSFITDPNKKFAANDPTAQALLKQYNNVKMPALGLSAAEVDGLIAYLESAAPAPAPAAPAGQVAGNPVAGRQIFEGSMSLFGGGPACIACHNVGGIGSLGGGALGPDLTHVVQRYPGPGLSSVLTNIAFPTMAGPFANRPLTPQETADLVAFFTQVDQQQPPVPVFAPGALTPQTWTVLGVGLSGATLLFGILLFFWPRQRQSISARLRNSRRTGRA